MSESRFPLIALLLILIANFAIYGIILVPGNTFAGMDFLNLTYPRTVLARDAMGAGHVPLWNWYEWGGAPLLATALGATCYPLTWLAMMIPLPYGLQLFVFVHLLAAGSGAWLLARQTLRIGQLPAAYVAIAYAGNAFFIGRIEQSQVIATNVLLPWLAWAVWRAVFRRQPGRPWVAVIWALTLLAGHPQFAAFNIIAALGLVGIVSITLPVRKGWNAKRFVFRWWQVIWQTALGTALAAVQLLPTWELSRLSERIWPYPDPTVPELDWGNLPAIIIPGFYNITTGETGRVMGYTELGLYAGVLTVPLALVGLCWAFWAKKSRTGIQSIARRRAVFAIGLAWFLSMVFALGSHAGLATIVYDNIPFFKQSRGAARSLNVAALMLALLSGQGVAWLSVALGRKWQSRGRTSTNGGMVVKMAKQVVLVLCLVTIADLAATHSSGLRSIMVPVEVLNARPLMPENIRYHLVSSDERVYRFMAFDSDIYLNNKPAAVAERIVRLQPNQNSLSHIGLVDGYEEGLFPLRDRANLFRMYNRNLRGPSPDGSLLAALGAGLMLTEYPISPDEDAWTPVSPEYARSPVVPSLAASVPPSYRWWRSQYPVSRVYALNELIPDDMTAEQFLTRLAEDFPLHSTLRYPPEQEFRDHIFAHISPQNFGAAKDYFNSVSGNSQLNRLEFVVDRPTSAALVMMPPYPGWKVSGNNLDRNDINVLNSISYLVPFRFNNTAHDPVKLIFSPFSFRFGLFVSLVAGGCFLIFFYRGPSAVSRK